MDEVRFMKISRCRVLGCSLGFLLMAVAGCGDKTEAPTTRSHPRRRTCGAGAGCPGGGR